VHGSRSVLLVVIAAALMALPACGTGEDLGGDYSANPVPLQGPPPRPGDLTVTSAPAVTGSRAGRPSVTPTPPPGGVALAARLTGAIGTVVTDADGYTLYRFDGDTPRPPASTCVDECAAEWPPVVVDPEGALDLDDVDRSAVGMMQRPDGTSQLTLDGWPLYRHAGDPAPGATDGHGLDGAWFAITPEGDKAG
jgi:predicted lipoprotein with Yx(FWY)xxD motif